MDGPAYEIEKQSVDRIGARDKADFRQHLFPMPAVGRIDPNVPLELGAARAVLDDRPELGALAEQAKLRRMVGETSNAGEEAEPGFMRLVDGGRIVGAASVMIAVTPYCRKDARIWLRLRPGRSRNPGRQMRRQSAPTASDPSLDVEPARLHAASALMMGERDGFQVRSRRRSRAGGPPPWRETRALQRVALCAARARSLKQTPCSGNAAMLESVGRRAPAAGWRPDFRDRIRFRSNSSPTRIRATRPCGRPGRVVWLVGPMGLTPPRAMRKCGKSSATRATFCSSRGVGLSDFAPGEAVAAAEPGARARPARA